MKALKIIIVIVVVGVAGVGLYTYQSGQLSFISEKQVEETPADRMAVETYVQQNISALSPEPEVLGGTFYVTDISVEGGQGTVSYEDGHIALTAEFTYTIDRETGAVSIRSFVITER